MRPLKVATELTYGNQGLVPIDKARALTFAKKVCDQPPDAQYSGYQSAACELTCFLIST